MPFGSEPFTHYGGEVGIRDRAIIETLYSTGMRRTELAELKLYDLDLDQGTVFIRQGKGQRAKGSQCADWGTGLILDWALLR